MNQPPAYRQAVTVKSPTGLHLRPISLIVETVRKSGCEVTVGKGAQTVQADNILDLMTLNAGHGTVLELEAHGERAGEVVEQLVRLFESNFEEGGTPEA